jgi:hypothetical protein
MVAPGGADLSGPRRFLLALTGYFLRDLAIAQETAYRARNSCAIIDFCAILWFTCVRDNRAT